MGAVLAAVFLLLLRLLLQPAHFLLLGFEVAPDDGQGLAVVDVVEVRQIDAHAILGAGRHAADAGRIAEQAGDLAPEPCLDLAGPHAVLHGLTAELRQPVVKVARLFLVIVAEAGVLPAQLAVLGLRNPFIIGGDGHILDLHQFFESLLGLLEVLITHVNASLAFGNTRSIPAEGRMAGEKAATGEGRCGAHPRVRPHMVSKSRASNAPARPAWKGKAITPERLPGGDQNMRSATAGSNLSTAATFDKFLTDCPSAPRRCPIIIAHAA